MREIKFRAKEIATGEWLIGSLQPEDDEVSLAVFFACLKTGRLIAETLGLFTTLPDKSGKEIYEGDIVEKWSHCSLLDRLSPLYNRGVGYYKSLTTTVKWSERGLNYNIYPHHGNSYWKVIGNIYENPELLKESK